MWQIQETIRANQSFLGIVLSMLPGMDSPLRPRTPNDSAPKLAVMVPLGFHGA